ncbi:MAG: cupin domain-containing protein [Desulfobacterales bacterium]|nr:cupin domain-containing protein [Desulfobacterales bacterium]MBF0396239.1 cupin domain-containing protein [Desulfobacterales bacterium]
MKITHYSQIEPKHFDGPAVKGVKGRVAIGKADGANNFCMRIFEIEQNGFSPRHTHEWEHEIFIHSGRGEVLCNDKWVSISSGYCIYIPGEEEHQIKNTGDSLLIFACLIPKGVQEI